MLRILEQPNGRFESCEKRLTNTLALLNPRGGRVSLTPRLSILGGNEYRMLRLGKLKSQDMVVRNSL